MWEFTFGLPFDAAFLFSCFARCLKPYVYKQEPSYESLCEVLMSQLNEVYHKVTFGNKFLDTNSHTDFIRLPLTSKKNAEMDQNALELLRLALREE